MFMFYFAENFGRGNIIMWKRLLSKRHDEMAGRRGKSAKSKVDDYHPRGQQLELVKPLR